MANVTMDLQELKALENQLEQLRVDKEKLLAEQKQVIVYHKHFNGKIKAGKRDDSSINIHGIRSNLSWDRGRTSSRYDSFDIDTSISKALMNGWIEVDLTEDSERTTKDYMNLSEVQAEIRESITSEVRESIEGLKQRVYSSEALNGTVESKHKKEIIKLKDDYDTLIADLKDKRNKEINEDKKTYDSIIEAKKLELDNLKQEFEDFKADKERVSLEQQIAELTAELKAEKEKSFWSKLFK